MLVLLSEMGAVSRGLSRGVAASESLGVGEGWGKMLEDPPGGLCNNDCGPVQAGWGEGDADWPHSGCSEDSADVIYSWMWV